MYSWMPFAEEEMISKLEENIKNLSSVITMLDAGKTPEGMLEVLLSGMDLEINDTLPGGIFLHRSATE